MDAIQAYILSKNQGKVLDGKITVLGTETQEHISNGDIHTTKEAKEACANHIADEAIHLSAEQVGKIDEVDNKVDIDVFNQHTSSTDIHMTAEERIKLNKLENKVDKTDIATTLSSASTDEQVASAKAVYDVVDNVQVGGRNLAKNTSNQIEYVSTSSSCSDSWNLAAKYLSGRQLRLETGQTYTVSWDYEFDWSNVSDGVQIDKLGAGIGSYSPKYTWYDEDTFASTARYSTYGSGANNGRFVYTFKYMKDVERYFAVRFLKTTGECNAEGLIAKFSNFKVEKGNKSTDWQPSPEDVQNQIDTSKQLLDDIASASKLTSSEKLEIKREWIDIATEYGKYELQCTSYGVSYTAYKNAYNVLDSYLNTINSGIIFNMNSTTDISRDTFNKNFSTYYSAKVDMLNALEYAKAKKEADNIQVGGRNLVTETSDEWTYLYTPSTAQNVLGYYKSFILPDGTQKGDMFTISYDLKLEGFDEPASSSFRLLAQGRVNDSWSYNNPFHNGLPQYRKDGIYHAENVAIIADASLTKYDVGFRSDNANGEGKVYIKCFKIERGNKATDYTEAPEDIDTKIDDLNTSLNAHTSSTDIHMTAEERIKWNKVENKVDKEDLNARLAQRENYSTSEQVVGSWIDGKTLYQKTVDFGTLPNANSKTVKHGIANVDLIWINQSASFAFQESTGQTWLLSLPTMGQCNPNVDRTSISIWAGGDRTNCIGFITLNYIKTSDRNVDGTNT